MANTPSADNYNLGRGKVYFDKLVSGTYEGERDLGNSPAFNLSVTLDKLDHFSSRSGLKAKDKTVVVQVTPTFNFNLDEINEDNVGLMFMATNTDVTQTANLDDAIALSTAFTSVAQDRWYDIGSRSIGCMQIHYDTLAGGTPAVDDDIYVGAPLTKDHKIVAVTALTSTTGILYLVNTDATNDALADDDIITDGVWTANADMSNVTTYPGNVAALATTNFLVYDTATPATVHTLTTDYLVDSTSGRVKIVDGGGITAGDNITVKFHRAAETYTSIKAFQETDIEGKLRFVSDNPVGNNQEVIIWRANITPSGEVGLISDEWQTLGFEGEILKDETGHPGEEYLRIIM